jgi:hypothetical protein
MSEVKYLFQGGVCFCIYFRGGKKKKKKKNLNLFQGLKKM